MEELQREIELHFEQMSFVTKYSKGNTTMKQHDQSKATVPESQPRPLGSLNIPGANHVSLTVHPVPTESESRASSHAAHRASEERWGVILAGGDGKRLLPLTRMLTGDERPKQFCAIGSDETLLETTRRRVALNIAVENTAVVVTETHERFYRYALNDLPSENLIVQSRNRGTAPAILYSLLRIAKIAPNSTVAFFPSDHYFSDDEKFMSHVEAAFDAIPERPDLVMLLGITPNAPEEQYGWIEPGQSIFANDAGSFYQVRRFWEKPSRLLAQELLEKGCLWNSFVVIGQVQTMLTLIQRARPDLYQSLALAKYLSVAAEQQFARELYSSLPCINFSQCVLTNRPEDLSIFPVSGVEWSDLGEPRRVLSTFGPDENSQILALVA
jgi:mannose-1-phosphate guanylyltransferase